MWSYYILVLCFIAYGSYCSEFSLDGEDCLLSSKNHSLIIDLSSAYTSEEVLGNNYTVYFSLCPRKLKKCPRNSYICLVDGAGKAVDIGSQVVGISYEGLYNIALRSAYGAGNVYTICSHNGELPPVFDSFSQAENTSHYFTYSINWMSSSSCPLRQFKTRDSCTLYTKDQSYDLRPLQYSTDLYAGHGPDKYLINFCKEVSYNQCENSPICHIRNGKPEGIARLDGSTFQHIGSRGLTLTYRNVKGGNTIISFVCSLNTSKPVVQFIAEHEEDLFFNVNTSMICPPIKMNCFIHHKPGATYDLSSLNRLKENWYLDLKNGKKLIFNICGPLNYIPNFLCSGGPYYACLVDSSNTTLALGFNSTIKVLRPGLISLQILGSTVDDKTFSLEMNLECARHGTYPSLIEKGTSLNNYSIHWKTEAACPSEMSRGNRCKVTNAYHLNEIDLSQLHKHTGDYIIKTGNESFRINICGNLNQSCSKTNDASICYKNKDGKELAVGQVGGSEPMFKDGQFLFHLEGEPCSSNVPKSKVKIIFMCEYFEGKNPNSKEGPEYFPSANECEFNFVWRTNLVCGDGSISNECSLKGNNKTFDLSPLRNLKENYVVNYNETTNIVLNVCHSVLPDHRIRCHITSGACLVNDDIDYILSNDYTMKKMHENLGLVSDESNFEYINGEIRLTYTNGGICPSGPEATHKTVIIFECDKLANDTCPVIVSSEQCEYIFKWKTRFACPLDSGEPSVIPSPSSDHKQVNENKCIVNVMSKIYDLTALMGKDWHVENKNLILGVCSPVKYPGCPIHTGACLMNEERGPENIGNYNANLNFEENVLFLYYNTSKFRQTKIIFTCSKTDLHPKFIEERKTSDGLTTFISWPTSLVCDKDVEETCCHRIEKLCDTFSASYKVAVDSKRSVFLSLCRPVIPDVGLLCPQNTASCMGTETDDSFIDEKSLGVVVQEPIFNKDRSVRVEYFNGSLCKDDIKYSTSIRFFCDNDYKNIYPQFVGRVEDCRYEFDWGTNLLCNDLTNCTEPFLSNSAYSTFRFVGADHYINGSTHKYILNLCKPSLDCGSFICKLSTSKMWDPFVGHVRKQKTSKEGIIYYLTSTHSMPDQVACGAEIDFRCSSSEVGPVLVEESDCFIRIRLEGKAFCSLLTSTSSDTNENTPTPSSSDEKKNAPTPSSSDEKKNTLTTEKSYKNVDMSLPTQSDVDKGTSTAASSWYIVPILVLLTTIMVVVGILYMKSRRRDILQSMNHHVFRYRRLLNRVSMAFDEEENSVEMEITKER